MREGQTDTQTDAGLPPSAPVWNVRCIPEAAPFAFWGNRRPRRELLGRHPPPFHLVERKWGRGEIPLKALNQRRLCYQIRRWLQERRREGTLTHP